MRQLLRCGFAIFARVPFPPHTRSIILSPRCVFVQLRTDETEEQIIDFRACLCDFNSAESDASATVETRPSALPFDESQSMCSLIEQTQEFIPVGCFSRPAVMFCGHHESFRAHVF